MCRSKRVNCKQRYIVLETLTCFRRAGADIRYIDLLCEAGGTVD